MMSCGLSDHFYRILDLTEEELEKIKKAEKLFRETQDIIENKLGNDRII